MCLSMKYPGLSNSPSHLEGRDLQHDARLWADFRQYFVSSRVFISLAKVIAKVKNTLYIVSVGGGARAGGIRDSLTCRLMLHRGYTLAYTCNICLLND